MSKLTNNQVKDLRRRVKNGEVQSDLAVEYGLSAAAVNKIILNKTYKNI